MNYSSELQILILLAHLKARGVRKIIASPGTTNMNFVLSCQADPFFEVYSSVDERSASYIAVGLSHESGEPVVLSCTGATASRNYLPGITEAYYRNLPIIAVTSSQSLTRVGMNVAQVIDRSVQPNDTYKLSFVMDRVLDDEDEAHLHNRMNQMWFQIATNPGPIHINLVTYYSDDFNTKELPTPRIINFINADSMKPLLKPGKIAIHIKSGVRIGDEENSLIDQFCEAYDAIVIGDHTSPYTGKYKVLNALVSSQSVIDEKLIPMQIIQIGDITGDYSVSSLYRKANLWRVDGLSNLIKTNESIEYFFNINLSTFFTYYLDHMREQNVTLNNTFYNDWISELSRLLDLIPELPLSNIWIAHQSHDKIPLNSRVHLGILNTLRSWNLFVIDQSVKAISNVGGFGIDGNLSSFIGASLFSPNTLFYGIFGDLAFFYDMNSMGNREIRNNLRIILINNGTGTEFKNFNHRASNFDSDKFVAAKGHFGNKSNVLVKSYSESLGFDYFAVNNKRDFEEIKGALFSPDAREKSIVVEIFVDEKDESLALELITNINTGTYIQQTKNKLKRQITKSLGPENVKSIKKALGRN